MSITSATGATQTTPTSTSTSPSSTVSKDQFLTLLTSQLKAQDPLNPMDATGFTAQLAQFSSLEQLTNMNTSMTSMLSSQYALQNTMATGFIGKKVSYDGSSIALANGQSTLNYHLDSAAASVKISIYDSSGKLVRTDSLANQASGSGTYNWNGRDNNGSVLADGTYNYTVTATDSTGATVTATPLTSGTVTGIVYDSTGTHLTLDNGTSIQFGDIQAITG
jgi:flagellar basal-body rod modification protein FlgD